MASDYRLRSRSNVTPAAGSPAHLCSVSLYSWQNSLCPAATTTLCGRLLLLLAAPRTPRLYTLNSPVKCLRYEGL